MIKSTRQFARFSTSMLICFIAIFLSSALSAQQKKSELNLEKYDKFDESMQVRDILVDAENTKWLASDKGIYKFTAMHSDWIPVLTGRAVGALAYSKRMGVWAGTSDGTILDDRQVAVGKIANPLIHILSMCFVRNQLWIGTDDGIYTFNPKLKRFSKHYIRKKSELPNDTVNVIILDPNGTVFVGTNGGLAIIHRNKSKQNWKVFNKKERFQAATVNKEGVWVVSDKEMYLVDYNYKYRWYPTAVKRNLSEGQVRALAADGKGKIYIASKMLIQFDPYEDKATRLDEDSGFLNASSLALVADKNDDIWIGSSRKGIYRIETTPEDVRRLTAVATTAKDNPCAGAKKGEIKVAVHGGKSPYTYKWSIPGIHGKIGKMLPSGKYKITVTDAEGHVYVTSSRISEPAALRITVLDKEDVSAPGARDGSAKIHVDGGTPDYRIRWSSGARGPVLQRARSGEHTVYVTDANKCKIQEKITIGRPNTFAKIKTKDLRVGQILRIDKLQFEADSTVVMKSSEAILDDVYQFMENNPSVVIEVGGHTNGLPPHSYCDRLSSARARNVASYLIRKGIPAMRISYKGYGKRKPIATNRTKEGRAKNQRVEIKIITIE